MYKDRIAQIHIQQVGIRANIANGNSPIPESKKDLIPERAALFAFLKDYKSFFHYGFFLGEVLATIRKFNKKIKLGGFEPYGVADAYAKKVFGLEDTELVTWTAETPDNAYEVVYVSADFLSDVPSEGFPDAIQDAFRIASIGVILPKEYGGGEELTDSLIFVTKSEYESRNNPEQPRV